jgi:SAM-dependent methyltransferase
MKKTDFDLYTEDYNRLLRQQTGFFSSKEEYFAQHKVGLVRERLGFEPQRVLEFGCGIGRNIPFLRQAFRSASITGSDISAKSLEVARAHNPGVEFRREPDDMRDEFDLIFIAGVFHHIPCSERVAVARTIHSRLAPGGHVFIFEHNPYNPVTRRIVSNCPYDEDAVLLSPAELGKLLQKAGCIPQGRWFSLFFPPRLRALLPIERHLGWLPLGGQYWVQAIRP